jgi:hypothetical protein
MHQHIKYLIVACIVAFGFTSLLAQEKSSATFETKNLHNEASQFLRFEKINRINSSLFDHTKSTSSQYSIRLSGSSDDIVGVAKSLDVMPGDTIKVSVFVKYIDHEPSPTKSFLNNIIMMINYASYGVIEADQLLPLKQLPVNQMLPIGTFDSEKSLIGWFLMRTTNLLLVVLKG